MKLYLHISILVLLASTARAQEAQNEAGRSFRANCMGCHQAPDVRFGPDRAWLDQIRRTA